MKRLWLWLRGYPAPPQDVRPARKLPDFMIRHQEAQDRGDFGQ